MAQEIVGRDTELAALERMLARPDEGPVAAAIEGEAGIGKTSVWEESVRRAETMPYRVLRCRPAEAETRLSYSALGDLLAQVADEELGRLVGPQRHALEVALLRADLEEPADPRAIATGLVALLTNLTEGAAVLVAVDDVQWLDADSARALEFAFRRLPRSAAVILGRRSDGGDPAPLRLDRSLPPERLHRLVLGPLSLAALYSILRQRLGRSFSRPTVVRLHELARGNPFFALEIGRELLRRGGEPSVGERLPVPSTLQDLVAARIEALSPTVREVLLAASALSRPEVDPIEDALGRPEEVGAAFIAAEEAGVVTIEAGRVAFTHPLLASTVYASASGERRRRLHARLATVRLPEEERARHLALSLTSPDEGVSAILERAAEKADRRGAQHAAAELFEWSWRLTPLERREDLARRTLREASALFAAGDLARSRNLAEAAVESAAPGALRAEAYLVLARISHFDRRSRVATENLERALADAGDDRRLRGWIHCELSWLYVNEQVRAVEHAEEAIRLLDAEEEPGLMAFAVIRKFVFDVQLGRGADRRLLDRGLDLEAKATRRLGAMSDLPLIWFKSMDEFDAARARYESGAEWVKARGDEGSAAEMLAQLAEVELRAGNWDLAARYIEESCTGVKQLGPAGPLLMAMRIRAMIDAHLGRIQRARETLTEIIAESERAQDLWWESLSLSTLGFVELTAGNNAAADRALTRMAEHLPRIGVVDALGQRGEPDHIEALASLGELDQGRLVLERLEERGERLPRLWIAVTLPRCRALILATAGETPAALQAIAEGVEHPSAGNLPFELARTLLLKGQLHRRMKQKRAAKDTLSRALEIFERLGSPPWAERARGELDRVGLRAPGPDELTRTESRVAELAAKGMTNREVAEAAFISPKTVEANLSRVYRKLGIRSRAELGARMAERAGPPRS